MQTKGRLIRKMVLLRKDQVERLEKLHQVSRVPMAEYIREALDMVLDRYKDKIKGK